MSKQRHPFHLVRPSFWPLFMSLSLFILVLSFVGYIHFFNTFLVCLGSALPVLLCFFFWSRDVVTEATFEGMHTRVVQRGLRLGVILFIVSEIMFFFGFFWAFFHSSLSPAIQIGCFWPPEGIKPFNPWGIPLLNTFILLLSGLTITCVHYYLLSGQKNRVFRFYLGTLILAFFFTYFQFYEYSHASFDISDGIYGSTFYMTTGLHGLHVILGTIAIFVSFVRTNVLNHFTQEHHLGFEASAWYWHFVDVVWLFLFVSIYWWGGLDFYSL